jgi:hypothetical protein
MACLYLGLIHNILEQPLTLKPKYYVLGQDKDKPLDDFVVLTMSSNGLSLSWPNT